MTPATQFLHKCITQARDKRLPFETFMELALYHPEFGYYAQSIEGIGKAGDFTTSAQLHPVLGVSIGRWIRQRASAFFSDSEVNIIELGGGTGALAQTVLEEIGEGASLDRFRYHIVEMSEPLRGLQFDCLKDCAQTITHHDSIEAALDATAGEALIFSNEFVDAFPCIQLIWKDEDWREVYLSLEDGELAEVLGPHRVEVGCEVPAYPREGQRCLLQISYFYFLQKLVDRLKRGSLLTIDYGGLLPSREVRAYYRQEPRTGGDIYSNVGEQDLTADVNFEDLKNWGNAVGLKSSELMTQREFILEHYPEAEDVAKREEACAYLLASEGAGDAFKVLEQSKF